MAEESNGHVCPPSVVKFLNCPLRALIQNPRKIMGAHVKPGDTVVDLGCGGGFLSVALAKRVGESGRVIAVDLQEPMLEITKKFAARKGVLDSIALHQCKGDDLGLTGEKVDFAVALFVVHEVPDRKRFLRQVADLLKPDARFALIEPSFHVSVRMFEQILEEAESVGLKQVRPLKNILTRGVVLSLSSSDPGAEQ